MIGEHPGEGGSEMTDIEHRPGRRAGRPVPAWTAVGVIELFEAEALVEISCEAVLPAGGGVKR
jgi:hypothetical protein